jgi:hypothetical protein
MFLESPAGSLMPPTCMADTSDINTNVFNIFHSPMIARYLANMTAIPITYITRDENDPFHLTDHFTNLQPLTKYHEPIRLYHRSR